MAEETPTVTREDFFNAVTEAFESKRMISLIPAKQQRASIQMLIRQRFTYRYSSKNNRKYNYYAVLRDILTFNKLFELMLFEIGETLERNIKVKELVQRTSLDSFVYTI